MQTEITHCVYAELICGSFVLSFASNIHAFGSKFSNETLDCRVELLAHARIFQSNNL